MLKGGPDTDRLQLRADLTQGTSLRLSVVAVEAVDAALRVLDEAVGDEDRFGTTSTGAVATLPSGCQVRTTRSVWECWMPPRALCRTWASAVS